jgi:GNAT superfamily N-acetyltransferase
MSQQFTLREMQPADGPALRQLMENDPETPGMSITTRFLVDVYQAWMALKPDMIGVVAEAPGVDGLVGMATAAFEDIQFDGRVLPSAFLENLKVHHAYRGQGLGTKLAQWRVDRARERFGGEGVILTGTTTDNTASLATMKKWCKQFVGPFTVAPRSMRIVPPPLRPQPSSPTSTACGVGYCGSIVYIVPL